MKLQNNHDKGGSILLRTLSRGFLSVLKVSNFSRFWHKFEKGSVSFNSFISSDLGKNVFVTNLFVFMVCGKNEAWRML